MIILPFVFFLELPLAADSQDILVNGHLDVLLPDFRKVCLYYNFLFSFINIAGRRPGAERKTFITLRCERARPLE